jgi:hypothetical protein
MKIITTFDWLNHGHKKKHITECNYNFKDGNLYDVKACDVARQDQI